MPEPIDVVEALLFASDTPLEAERIREVLDLSDAADARALVDALRERYAAADGALTVVEVAGGFRMVTRPEIAPWLVRLAKTRTKARLSRPSLETLAIVAYRQPVSRPEVDALRGVNSDAVLDNLLENARTFLRELVRAKPAAAKGAYMKSLTLSSTMGPPITLDPTAVTADLTH